MGTSITESQNAIWNAVSTMKVSPLPSLYVANLGCTCTANATTNLRLASIEKIRTTKQVACKKNPPPRA